MCPIWEKFRDRTPWEKAVRELGLSVLLSFGRSNRTISDWRRPLPKGGVPAHIMERAREKKRLEDISWEREITVSSNQAHLRLVKTKVEDKEMIWTNAHQLIDEMKIHGLDDVMEAINAVMRRLLDLVHRKNLDIERARTQDKLQEP
jgi:hypothetical protein